MLNGLEGKLSEALDRISDEAPDGFDEAQSEVSADEKDEAGSEVAEWDGDESEETLSRDEGGEPDDGESAGGNEEDEDEVFSWDGDPNSLTGRDKIIYDSLHETVRKGAESWMSRKASAWDLERKEYQRRLSDMEAYVREQQQLAAAPQQPQRPGDGATQDEWDAYFAGIARRAAWEQHQELQKQQNAKPVADDRERALVDAQTRAKKIESLQDYTDDIGVKMVELAESDEFWADAFRTDHGAMKLFSVAKLQVEADRNKKAAAQAKSAEIKHKASAANRSVRKPGSKSGAKGAPQSPHRKWADMTFDEKFEAAFDDTAGEFGI